MTAGRMWGIRKRYLALPSLLIPEAKLKTARMGEKKLLSLCGDRERTQAYKTHPKQITFNLFQRRCGLKKGRNVRKYERTPAVKKKYHA